MHDDDVVLFLCLFVCLFVCLSLETSTCLALASLAQQRNAGGPAAGSVKPVSDILIVAGAFYVDHLGRIVIIRPIIKARF